MVRALEQAGARVRLKTSESGCTGSQAGLELVLEDGRSAVARLDFTSKGNGSLELGNLAVHVHDEHDDGVLYEPPTLRLRLADLDADGRLDLMVEGVAVDTETGERRLVLGRYREVGRGRWQVVSERGPRRLSWRCD